MYNVQSLDSTIDCLYNIFKQFDVDINDDLKSNHSNLIQKLSEELEQFQMSWEQLQTEVNTTHQTMYQHLEQMELFNCKQLSLRKLLTEIEQKACLGPCSTTSVVDFNELEKDTMNCLNEQYVDEVDSNNNNQGENSYVVIFDKLMIAQQSIVDWWEVSCIMIYTDTH